MVENTSVPIWETLLIEMRKPFSLPVVVGGVFEI